MTEGMHTHLDDATLDRVRTGEIEEPERARAAQHVAACAECARRLADLEAFAALVGRAYAADRAEARGEEPDWARLRERVLDATRAGSPEAAAAGARPGLPTRRWSRWAPQLAAAVVAALVLGVLWREGVRGPGDARRAVEAPMTAERQGPAAAEEPAVAEEPAGAAPTDIAPPGPATALESRAGEAAQDRRGGQEARQNAPSAPPPDFRARDEVAAAGAAAKAEEREAGRREAGFADASAADALEPHDRFAVQARAALAAADTAAARRTLALWRDTLAARADLDSALRGQAESLADSLAAFLAHPRE